MKERPIIYSTEMIKAILDDKKTMTRRTRGLEKINKSPDDWIYRWDLSDFISHCFNNKKTGEGVQLKCPYGVVGDRLWVKETWADAGEGSVYYRSDGIEIFHACDFGRGYPLSCRGQDCAFCEGTQMKWKPSLFMPRRASRGLLGITGIRAERLQSITHEDVIAEGVQYPVTEEGERLLRLTGKYPPCDYLPPGLFKDITVTEEQWLKAHFASLWDTINNKKYPWEDNCWVWVIEYRRVK